MLLKRRVFAKLALSAAAAPAWSRKRPESFELRRGTNVSHWLSQSKRRGQERRRYFQRSDVEFLARLGLDHLRIPVDEEQLWDEEGRKDTEAFGLLQNALDWCEDFNLKAVVDLHILRSHHFNRQERPLWTQPEAQERFLECWRDLSEELRRRPLGLVAYELMNEPVADDPDDWNRLVARAVAVVRETEPERKIVIGSNRWQSVHTFQDLRVPENDPNIILSFHFYHPMALTHYRAGWTKVGEYDGPVRYPGRLVPKKIFAQLPEGLKRAMDPERIVFNRKTIRELIGKPVAVARRLGLPLYCGEWGCYYKAPMDSRLRWYRDVRRVLEQNGIAWATWDYKGGFGLVRDGRPVKKLIRTLGLRI